MPNTYKLLPQGLADAHVALGKVIKEAAERLHRPQAGRPAPPGGAEPAAAVNPFAELATRYDALERRVCRSHYRVGFVGGSNNGKSTAVRNLFDVSIEDSPTKEGPGGKATTAVATRVHTADANQTEHTCTVVYMTQRQYQARVKAIREFFQLSEAPHTELSGRVKRLFQPTNKDDEAEVGKIATHQQRAAEDIRRAAEYFHCLLTSYEAFGRQFVLKDKAREERVPYADRVKYTTHAPGAYSPAHHLLTQEVEIAFCAHPHVGIHDLIEIVDLPGTGTVNPTDDLTTELYLPELAGAVVFRKAIDKAGRDTSLLLERLRAHFVGQMGHRVWLSVTQFENLGQVEMFGPPQTFFDGLMEFVGSFGLSVENLTLLYRDGYLYRKEWAGILHKRVSPLWPEDSGGSPIEPQGLAMHAGLWEMIRKSVFVDGGIGRLRGHLQDTLEPRVRAAEEQYTRKELLWLKNQLKALIEGTRVNIEQRGKADLSLRAGMWQGAVKFARSKVLEPGGEVDQAAERLIQILNRSFTDTCNPTQQWTPDEVYTHHQNWATGLRDKAKGVEGAAGPEGIAKIYAMVAATLTASEAAMAGPFILGGGKGPVEHWTDMTAADAIAHPWNPWFDTFTGVPLFPQGQRLDMEYSEYRELMEEKITITVHLAFDEVASRIGMRLDEIDGQLGILGRDQPWSAAESTEQISACERLLQELTSMGTI